MTDTLRLRRAGLLLTAAAALVCAAFLVPGRATADVGDGPGGLTLTPGHGDLQTAPFASYSSANPCPTDARDSYAVTLSHPDGTLDNLAAGTPVGDTPPSGQLDPTNPLSYYTTSSGTGDYEVDVICYNADFSTLPLVASAVLHVDVAANSWEVVGGQTPPGGAVATTTTLTADPTTATEGDAVSLTAAVTGDGAAGTVEFDNGATSLGTAEVSGGAATTTVSELPVGADQLTAKFIPTDATAFAASTSDPVTVTVTASGSGGTDSGHETIKVTVPPDGGSSDFSVTVDPADVTLAVNGLSATGSLSPITVNDQRTDSPGWSVSGQAAEFAGSGTQTIPATNLGWAPAFDGDAHDAVAGPQIDPGDTGLSAPATLASASSGTGQGSTTLGGRLTLSIPPATPTGDYASTLTITTMAAAVS